MSARERSERAASPDDRAVTRGADAKTLERPAGELLASIPWEGLAPNPDTLDAPTFLAWL